MAGVVRRSILPLLAVGLLVGPPALAAHRGPSLPPDVPASARARLAAVTTEAALAVRVDGQPFVARPEVFEYLLDHPELATHVTRELRVARYRIWRTPKGLAIDDGWGTVGIFEVVHAGPRTRVLHARGVYRQSLLPDIRGEAVVVIDYEPRPAPEGGTVIATSVGGFVKLDSATLARASRLASAVARAKGEKEAHRLVKVFAKATRAIEADPAGLCDRLERRPEVPAAELEEFRRLLSASAGGDRDRREARTPASRH